MRLYALQVQDGLVETGSCCCWRLRGPWLVVDTLVSWTLRRHLYAVLPSFAGKFFSCSQLLFLA